jgi:hypothetical protein
MIIIKKIKINTSKYIERKLENKKLGMKRVETRKSIIFFMLHRCCHPLSWVNVHTQLRIISRGGRERASEKGEKCKRRKTTTSLKPPTQKTHSTDSTKKSFSFIFSISPFFLAVIELFPERC